MRAPPDEPTRLLLLQELNETACIVRCQCSWHLVEGKRRHVHVEALLGGRPPWAEEDIPLVRSLMQALEVLTSDICERFGISRATLYVGPEGERRR